MNILFDGNNLLHVAYHTFISNHSAIPRIQHKLVYGSMRLLVDWTNSAGRFESVSFFVDGVPVRRRALDPTYKTHKDNVLSNLQKMSLTLSDGYDASSEIDIILHILQLLGVQVYFDPNEEADDLIASFIKQRQNESHMIVSSDKDFFQLLVNPNVVVYRPISKGCKLLNAAASAKHWGELHGGDHPAVPAKHVRMFKSICGDKSDNIPGVPRLRKKVAVAAIASNPSIEKLVAANWPGFSQVERENANELINRIKLNWKLVGLVDNIDVKPVSPIESNYDLASKILNDLDIPVDVSPLIPICKRAPVYDPTVATIDTAEYDLPGCSI